MRKYLLFFLVAFSLSSILVTAHHEQVYYVGFDAGGDSHVYRYDPQTSTTTSVYTIASPGAYIVSVAADTKGNYYAYIYRGLYGPSSFIIKNGQTLFSLRRADYGHLFVDLQDRLYFSLNPNFSPRGEVYRVDPTGPTLLYKTPDNLAADGFAVDSKNNLYVFVGGTLAPTLLTKNGALQYTLHRPPYTQNYGGESSMNIKDELYFLHWVYNYGGRSFIYTALYRYDTKTGRLFGPTRFTGQVVGGVATDSEGNVYMTVSSSSSPFAGSLLKNGQPVASLYRGGAVAIPQHVPVLLVHGIYSDDSMWNSLASLLSQPPYNYHVHTVGQVLGQGGLYPNNGDITSLAKQLEAATEKLGSAKVDVIAHSMGGLVTRHYMTSHFYPSNIRNFIMLGTPNAGAPIAASPVTNLARFFGLIRGDDPKDTGRYQMHPRSTFLTNLNANFRTQGATINAIAGTKLNPVVLLASPSYLFRVTDSIVPRSSVRLAGLNCYSTPVTHSPQLGITYTNHQDTIDALVSILEGRPRLLPSCPESFSAAEQNTVQSTVIHGTITSQQVLTLKTLPLNKPFTGMLNWTSAQGQLALEFISPQGVSINVSSYQNVLNVSYSTTTLEDQTYEAFVFEQPSPGLWTIKVHAPSITAPTGFSFTLFAESTISLEVTTDKSSYKPLDPLLLTAQLLNNSVPVLNARVTAFITKPDTTIAQLQMFDDGLHNDGAPNDGVYGNQFTGTSLEGTYPILVRVPLEDAFVIEESALAFVERLPDLDVQASNVQITPGQLTLGQNATINIAATIRNIGDKEAQNVTVYFYDGDPAEYGEELGNVSYSSVPVNGVIQPSTSFLHIAASDPTLEISGTANLTATINISVADHALRSHDIYVLAELDGLEANTTNNLVHKQVGFGAVPYVVALSLGNAGIPLGDGRVIPLSYDGIFEISLYYPLVLGLAASQGVLDDEGKATATWTIPNIPLLVGLPFHVGFVTLDTTQQFPGLIYSISAEEPIVIQP